MGATRATAGALQSVGLKGFGKALLSAEKGIARFAVGSARLATGIGAVTLVTEGLTMALGYFLDNTKAINAAIEAGDVGQAGVEARTQQNTQNTISAIGGGASGAGIGAVIGTMIAPGIGTAIGAAFGGTFGALNAWANGLEESTITQAEAAAGVVRANKEMAESASKASKDIDDFNKGLRESTFEGSATEAIKEESGLNQKNIDQLIKEQREAARPDTMGYAITNRFLVVIKDLKKQKLWRRLKARLNSLEKLLILMLAEDEQNLGKLL